jgi:AbrB family looped-hinge helix DNA binding protein
MKMKIYNKGQVVIPVNIRKKYNLNIGDYVDVVIEDNVIKLIPFKKKKVVDTLFGILNKSKERKEITQYDIDKVTEDEFVKGWNKQ